MSRAAVRFAVLGRRSGGEWAALLRHAGSLLSAANGGLPGQLLPEAVPLHSLSVFKLDVRRLLSEADSLPAVLVSVRIVR